MENIPVSRSQRGALGAGSSDDTQADESSRLLSVELQPASQVLPSSSPPARPTVGSRRGLYIPGAFTGRALVPTEAPGTSITPRFFEKHAKFPMNDNHQREPAFMNISMRPNVHSGSAGGQPNMGMRAMNGQSSGQINMAANIYGGQPPPSIHDVGQGHMAPNTYGGQPPSERQVAAQGHTASSEINLQSVASAPYPTVAPTPIQSAGSKSQHLEAITRQGRPILTVAMSEFNCPFVNHLKDCRPATWGVIKMTNIPYAVTKAEIREFFGVNAKLVPPSLGDAVHIMIDRTTAKTGDCFVEFLSVDDATIAMKRLDYARKTEGKSTRLLNRYVHVTLSSQEDFLKELFPKAKNIKWEGAVPRIVNTNEPFNSGFKSFLAPDELVIMTRMAEVPQRSGNAKNNPHRTFEAMMTILTKFPWFAVDMYTLAQRDMIFDACLKHVKFLVHHILTPNPGISSETLDMQLLVQLIKLCLSCPGFGEHQKWLLAQAGATNAQRVQMNLQAKVWPFANLGRMANVDDDVVAYYFELLKRGCLGTNMFVGMENMQGHISMMPSAVPYLNSQMSMEEAIEVELQVLEKLIQRGLQN